MVDLLWRVTVMPDAGDPATWLIGSRPLTREELGVVARLSREDLDDYESLVHLAIELKGRGA